MSRAFRALMPTSASLADVIAEHVAADRAEVEPLVGQPQLIAIARIDRELALALNRLIEQLQEANFSDAACTSDELSHRIRTHYLHLLSDKSGTVRR